MNLNQTAFTSRVISKQISCKNDLIGKISSIKSPKSAKTIITPIHINCKLALNIKYELENKIFISGKVVKDKSPKRMFKQSRLSKREEVKDRKCVSSRTVSAKSCKEQLSQEQNYFSSSVFQKEHPKLADSFQSYYESEKENLNSHGSCKKNYISFKLNYDKVKRKKARKDLRYLKNENEFIRKKLKQIAL